MIKIKFKLPAVIIGNIGEYVAYHYLSEESIKNLNQIKFIMPWDARFVATYCGIPDLISIPYQVNHTLKTLNTQVGKEKLTPAHPEKDNRGTNPHISMDLLSYTCTPPENILQELISQKCRQRYSCDQLQCPVLLRKLQRIFPEISKDSPRLEDQWAQIDQLVNDYCPKPKDYTKLTLDEQAKLKKEFPPLRDHPACYNSEIDMQGKTLSLSEAIPYILDDNRDGRFNQIILDHHLQCEYLQSMQFIEVKTVFTNKKKEVYFTYSEIKTLQHILSLESEINLSYQVLVLDSSNLMDFEISYLDNQKIMDATRNKTPIQLKSFHAPYINLI
ncbi:MAG TPA: hypothetical protein VMV49_17955 [Candidatus Deferrimicrobium sp.]|nr:hypothetical protein [Candidatus Deferrimicrobium sp.]